ncbi:ABC transporter ATP-binding protein [Oceanimonas baumannii]|uniref:ABC-type dipeptide transporter n=1 Tax=Oceanimonas baumannii TaxID=129578 RepID=A0A235CBR5_9GAMM|nr:ABC transporter ATP-binding protein [Oceanimonas baumannii]OYD21245.1 peptide ABC transporter ATP-binding protein [Oceanimonas baumannii]TDW55375.1 peptide/nickel transport system ATP-binding protein [Oceanimonas baumannii]
MSVLLEVEHLAVSFTTEAGCFRVVDDVSFSLAPGQTLGLVGESGCGKSVTALSLLGLLPQPAGKVEEGRALFQGADLLSLSPQQRYRLRGNKIAMIFQEPMTALNPVHTVGRQLMEVYELHRPELNKRQRRDAALIMLRQVGIPEAEARLTAYPHQLSGGMRQRVMIAIALACEPDLLICDEPTTALDVTIQAQILRLIRELQQQNNMAVIFITHDLGVVAQICDQVLVMYAGRSAEQAGVFDIFELPRHPYTQGLLASIPRLDRPGKTELPVIGGQVPSLEELPSGCRFANRCPYMTEVCLQQPLRETVGAEHHVWCHHWRELDS